MHKIAARTQLMQDLQQQLHELLRHLPDKIIQWETQALCGDNSTEALTAGCQALAQRQADLARLNNWLWPSLAHILLELHEFGQLTSHQQAVNLLPRAEARYCQLLQNYFPGRLAMRVEIGGNKSGFHIHAHVMADAARYEQFKLATEKLRRGASKSLSCRKAPRRRQHQSTGEYQYYLACYNTKFATLASWQTGTQHRTVISAPTAQIISGGIFFKTRRHYPRRQVIQLPARVRQSLRIVRAYEILHRRKNMVQPHLAATFWLPVWSNPVREYPDNSIGNSAFLELEDSG